MIFLFTTEPHCSETLETAPTLPSNESVGQDLMDFEGAIEDSIGFVSLKIFFK